jgi:uncharacterized membrane protein YeaQ/YmgE (transglycosylase-associated protein family)
MISLIVWVVFGFLAGSAAEWLWPAAKSASRLQTIGIGVAGSIAGGLLGSVVSGASYRPAGFVFSVIGALLVTFAWRKFNEVK